MAGTTRDVLAQPVEWLGRSFALTDTGGMFGASEDPLHALVLDRGHRAIADADVLVFVVDGREGVVPGDREIAEAVRAANVPVLLAINKCDDKRARAGALEFHQLGFDQAFEISAEHGEGTGDLLDAIIPLLPGGATEIQSNDPNDSNYPSDPNDSNDPNDPNGPSDRRVRPGPRDVVSGFRHEHPDEVAVAIIGRPNAGKSSLVNRLLKEERMIVSEMPGTTRDAVDTMLTWHKRQFRIVDTAGIRRAGRVAGSSQVEQVSVLLAKRAIEGADIVVVVVDAAAGVTDQDAAIAGEADKAGRGVIIVANKWDLMKGRGEDFSRVWDDELRRRLKFLDYASILHLSALTGERTPKLLEAIDRVAAARRLRVKTPALNKVVERIAAEHPPASPGRKHVRILYATQVSVGPPTFVFFTNVATSFHFSYMRFLENKLREAFGFEGTPVRIQVRSRRRKDEAAESATDKRPRAKQREKTARAKRPLRRASSGGSGAKPRGNSANKKR
jgi:GTP-binding protein